MQILKPHATQLHTVSTSRIASLIAIIIAMLFMTLSHAAKVVKAGTIIGEQKPVT